MIDQIDIIKNKLYSHILFIRENLINDDFESFNSYIVDITNKYQDIIDYLDRIILTSENFFKAQVADARHKYKIMNLNGRDVVLPYGLYEKIDIFLNQVLDDINSLEPKKIISLDSHRALNLENIQSHLTCLDNIETRLYDFFHSIVDYKSDKNLPFDSLERQISHYYKKFETLSNSFSELENNFHTSNASVNKIYNNINELNQKISDLNANILNLKNKYESDSTEVIRSIESKFIQSANEILSEFTKEIDATNELMRAEINNVKKTSKSFNEFISEETSIKLTNNFKEKSIIERNWYYGFNFISALIIGVAIIMSYSSLTNFAEKHSTDFTQLDLYYLAIRLLFSFLIFSTIAFTNKLANKHYFHWKKNESVYLKLTALKSFIVDMTSEKQQEIHEKLIDVYFGKEDLDPTIYKKYDNSSESLLKMIADKLPNIGYQKKSSN